MHRSFSAASGLHEAAERHMDVPERILGPADGSSDGCVMTACLVDTLSHNLVPFGEVRAAKDLWEKW